MYKERPGRDHIRLASIGLPAVYVDLVDRKKVAILSNRKGNRYNYYVEGVLQRNVIVTAGIPTIEC